MLTRFTPVVILAIAGEVWYNEAQFYFVASESVGEGAYILLRPPALKGGFLGEIHFVGTLSYTTADRDLPDTFSKTSTSMVVAYS